MARPAHRDTYGQASDDTHLDGPLLISAGHKP
ncbi:protein of unknown function [Cupriavidus taiwanensis]|uniref:Uncharacterized protein n=1 Tax=Cupriavidus taiwanensis TaxID=164546 RepID=A0A7Z7J4F0_9BURK|nr:protein of unknown function [Cupriavidus taiwanensis]SOZ03379.1 hypothetical protein CBM2597_A130028 [Cupriavidus taiwanensis]SPC07168.1 hypothetical protein CBM2594_A100028 [Cupriavidus taiwanensis]SPD41879.1 protein of unknown function [Cupriavidus taiwanensis]